MKLQFFPETYRGETVDLLLPSSVVRLSSEGGQAVLDAMWSSGMRPTGYVERPIPDCCVTINGRPASDYMSTDPVPDGHYTVISFLARFDPETIALMGPLGEATQRDGFWLSRECKRQGSIGPKVLAPKVLQELGIDRVNVYPEALLRRRFGL